MDILSRAKETLVVVIGLNPELKFADVSKRLTDVAKECLKEDGSSEEPVIWIPLDKNDRGDPCLRGFAYLHFSRVDESEKFALLWRTHPAIRPILQKDMIAYSYAQMKRLVGVPEECPSFGRDDFLEKRNFYSWVADDKGDNAFREQYVIRYKGEKWHETEVYWFDDRVPRVHREVFYDGTREHDTGKTLTTSAIQWSSNGSFLASLSRHGVMLWGGPEMDLVRKCEHQMVNYVDFSPNETCLITCNTSTPADEAEESSRSSKSKKSGLEQKVIVWDLTHKRDHEMRPFGDTSVGLALHLKVGAWWPVIKWGADDRFFAHRSANTKSTRFDKMRARDLNQLSIYDGSTFVKVGKESFATPNLYDFAFSPTQDLLAFTTRASGKDMASLTIISLPGKEIVKTQTLGGAVSCALYWQSNGDYVAVKIVLKDHSSRVGIMCVKDDGMPWILTGSMPKLAYFTWEPDSDRFAVLQNDNRLNPSFPSASFFAVSPPKITRILRLVEVERDLFRANGIHFAPMGGRAVISFIEPQKMGHLIFVDLRTGRTVKRTHDEANFISWDQSGRYLATASCQPMGSTAAGDETGYIIWSFQGEQLDRRQIPRFYQFQWRQRPALEALEIKKPRVDELKGRMEGYKREFEKSDRDVRQKHQSKHIQRNVHKRARWAKLRKEFERRTKKTREEQIERFGLEHVWKDEDAYEISEETKEMQDSYEDAVIDESIVGRVLSGERVTIESLDKSG
jgi:translation initiation factor 3 subunit B